MRLLDGPPPRSTAARGGEACRVPGRDERDWPVRGVAATVTDLDDEPLGSWHADADWFEALESGEMTEVEFSRRLIDGLDEEA